ncbi:MAG: glutamate racemase [Chloroflexi bacterium RBG_16_48_8]|nr:MAG: glutamate racemase [Chloroflexi bacterium RBG_16_48_8]
MKPASIGIFDSGVGGLSILREIRETLPQVPLLYFADQVHVPYGSHPMEEVHTFAEGISRFLITQGSKLIVVACNTASAAALHSLRSTFPQIPFVGMEPAVKPAALTSRTQKVGVLATSATFQGELFASVVERFAQGVVIVEQTLPGLVEQVEKLKLNSPETRKILTAALGPLLKQGIDTLVLACTHYPFVMPMIEEIAGPGVQIIDPAPAIARQTQRIWEQLAIPIQPTQSDLVLYYSTGDPERLVSAALQLIQHKGPGIKAKWRGSQIRTGGGD